MILRLGDPPESVKILLTHQLSVSRVVKGGEHAFCEAFMAVSWALKTSSLEGSPYLPLMSSVRASLTVTTSWLIPQSFAFYS